MVSQKLRTMDSSFNTQFIIILLFLFSPISKSFEWRDEIPDGIALPSSTNILIQGGTVVNADRKRIADVHVKNGIIVAVGTNIKVNSSLVTVLNATGKYVMPGGIDPHTHLDMDHMGAITIDDFFTGPASGLAGGTTMIMDFVMPINGSYLQGYEDYIIKANRSCTDYGFHVTIISWSDTVAAEMEVLVKKKGVNSFKFFPAALTDQQLIAGFKKCKALGAVAMVHAENGAAIEEGQNRMIALNITGPEGHALSRPGVVESEGTAKSIRFARFVNVPLYVAHVMSIDALEEVAMARRLGQRVIGQPIIAAMVLNDSWYWNPDFNIAARAVMSPPMMPEGHNKALQVALATGTLQLVGTDHCRFNSTQKALGINDFRKIPGGVNGIEERMHLTWDTMVESGKISVTDYVRITSTESARIFNIYPKKGVIRVGSDADIIILNPKGSFNITAKSDHSKSDMNVFDGMSGKGKVEVTIAGGKIVWQNNQLNVVRGAGIHIKTPPFGYLFDGMKKSDAAYRASLHAPSSFKITAESDHSKSDMNVFEGMTGKGKVEVTIAGGEIVWENNKLNVVRGAGNHIKTPPFGYLFNGHGKADAAYLASLNAPVRRLQPKKLFSENGLPIADL